jgi:hypothetical protein
VHLLAFLLYFGALSLGVSTLGAVAATATGNAATDFVSPEHVTVFWTVLDVVLGALSLTYLVLGIALQRGRQWARVVLHILAVLGLLGAVAAVLYDAFIGYTVVGVVGPVLTILMLNTRAARSWFRSRGAR